MSDEMVRTIASPVQTEIEHRTILVAGVDLRVLAALPMDLGAGRWLTPADVSERLSVAPDVARSVLVRLRGLGLALDDGERPQAFARTARADVLLEHAA
jgi:Flp pilus assembly protein CpaB